MKKYLMMIGVMMGVFLISIFITSLVINTESQDMTTEMSSATLPVLYTVFNNEKVNINRGYTGEMEGSFLRGPLNPLGENRELSIFVNTFGTLISEMEYEVRTMDMERLIENQKLTDYVNTGKDLTAVIHIKDLILPETEYMLLVKLKLQTGQTATYYIRFIDRQDLGLSEVTAFVKDFSQRTFDKEAAKDIKKYMEPNTDGDNSSFAYVNIHSNFNQLTWGQLDPVLIGEKEMSILDADPENYCIKLKYRVGAKGNTYKVGEYFRVKKGKERMYLMEYERTMDQFIENETEELLVNDKLIHGIMNDKLKYKENEDGNIFCFVQSNRLYCFNSNNNNLARVFSFWDENNDDIRTRFDEHGIKILTIDEQGSMYFLVYGYMNRGDHEGEEGIALYYYDSVVNTIEEQLFIPYGKAYAVLKKNIEALSYLNYDNIFYLYLDGSVYRISLDERKYELVANELDERRFVASNDNRVIAWQPERDVRRYSKLVIMSIDNEKQSEIKGESMDALLPLGFVNDDFVYGKIRMSDINTDVNGTILLPMYSICIMDESGNMLKDYHEEGFYIKNVEFTDNIINLKRLSLDGNGSFIEAPDDQIISSVESEVYNNKYKYVVTDEMETTYQTELYRHSSTEAVKVTNPKAVLFEGSRKLNIKWEDPIDRYFVYSKGNIDSIYTSVSDAVNRATDIFGNVVDKKCFYIYEAGNRKTSASIEDISYERLPDETFGSNEIIVDEMLKKAGVYKSSGEIQAGESALIMLKESLEKGVALDLTGCGMESVLYYVSQGFPVMSFTGGGMAVMIIGYDSNNVKIYDPSLGEPLKAGRKDAAQEFEERGNRFISYKIKKD
ncbi:MAG: hypothetical protein K5931_11400 [Lachnospiraceae bacterium]|nr:hypothetical protein [Lachnospiraceae bacterium]